MAPRALRIDDLRGLVGEHLGYSRWLAVTQERINQFAEATGDRQWIHVDPERAAREGPFGITVAHGYLTLALAPKLAAQLFVITDRGLGVNYGCERVRFPSPVPVGSRIRLGATLDAVVDIDEPTPGVQATLTFVIECEGAIKPSCVAQVVYRYYR